MDLYVLSAGPCLFACPVFFKGEKESFSHLPRQLTLRVWRTLFKDKVTVTASDTDARMFLTDNHVLIAKTSKYLCYLVENIFVFMIKYIGIWGLACGCGSGGMGLEQEWGQGVYKLGKFHLETGRSKNCFLLVLGLHASDNKSLWPQPPPPLR